MAITINAEARTDMGKGASRRLRRTEKMPAIVYGGSKKPASLTVLTKDIRVHLNDEAFFSQVLELSIDGKKAEKVVLRDIQYHPYKVDPMHLDFQRVSAKDKMHFHVPLHFTGEDVSPGAKHGGLVSHVLHEVEIECLARNIPEFIEVDMSAMDMGDSLHLTDLKLPKGVELIALKQGDDHDEVVVAIHAPRGGSDEDEAAAEEAEEGGEE